MLYYKIYESKKRILITGVNGQDGSNLIEYLLESINNIIIFGTVISFEHLNHENLKNVNYNKNFIPLELDLCDEETTKTIFNNIKPDYFFNCGGKSIPSQSHINAMETIKTNTIAPLFHMECIRLYYPKCRYLSFGSCEEFGTTLYKPQDLNHPCNPINIYGISKLATNNILNFYRKKYNLYLCHLILYNHESIKRSSNFVSKKITIEVNKIKENIEKKIKPEPLLIGNIFSTRDWSSSEDFVIAFWEILNKDKPDNYILSSGKSHTIKEFIDLAFGIYNIKLDWYINKKDSSKNVAYYNGHIVVKTCKNFYRDLDNTRDFVGKNTETLEKLRWKPKISFENLVEKMTINDSTCK